MVWFLGKSTLNPDLLYIRLLYNRILLYSSMRKVARAWTETFRSEVRKKLWDTLTGWGQWWADCKLSLHGNGSYLKYLSWLKHKKIFHTLISIEALSQNTHFLSFLMCRKFLIFFPAQLGGRFPTIFFPQGGTGKQLFRKQAPTESANSYSSRHSSSFLRGSLHGLSSNKSWISARIRQEWVVKCASSEHLAWKMSNSG